MRAAMVLCCEYDCHDDQPYSYMYATHTIIVMVTVVVSVIVVVIVMVVRSWFSRPSWCWSSWSLSLVIHQGFFCVIEQHSAHGPFEFEARGFAELRRANSSVNAGMSKTLVLTARPELGDAVTPKLKETTNFQLVASLRPRQNPIWTNTLQRCHGCNGEVLAGACSAEYTPYISIPFKALGPLLPKDAWGQFRHVSGV